MSRTPAVSEKVLCDLCGKEIDTYNGRNRSCMNWGIMTNPEHASTTWRTFLPNHWGENRKRTDSTSEKWDFHTSCLTDALRPLVEAVSK